ncbi:hypothetical protein QO034_13375 [Sedimentitalea sp. JM2-8]|uniref:Flagellin n=1 Tax=Sedimentitalea xiamensis TaxID=3050037 RepID=A0ABT7FG67_9RHOB|nr:hypothetical protein [Sedimentitalea xiamensis]MDK3074107.1 hypothetical protein [Sedimentitalea xiamensis]
MAYQPINTGTVADDGTGDTLRDAGGKINENFVELYAREEMASGDATKLAAIEAGATADQTGAEIKVLYEAEADTNAYDDAAVTKVGLAVVSNVTGITGATAIANQVIISQANYDAIGTPDANTIYHIVG